MLDASLFARVSLMHNQIDKILQTLFLQLKPCFNEHVDEPLVVCLSSSYHLVQLGTEAIEEDTLLLTATPAVLGHGLRLNQLQGIM